MTPLTVSAVTRPGNVPPGGNGGGGGGGGGNGSTGSDTQGTIEGEFQIPDGEGGSSTGSFSGVIDFPYPDFTTYTPKATILYSANAILANEGGEAVYFLPRIDDFPTNIAQTVTDLTDGNGTRHRFALVYSGSFDTDVVYILPTTINSGEEKNSRLLTSKKVYSLEESSRLLNMLGYDLLLSKEAISMTINESTGDIDFAYNATRLSQNAPLSVETCIMDLYKAVGVYEWDISFAYGRDSSFNINQSPLLQQIGFLTSTAGVNGIDVSEICTYVGATRTNPDLYWERSRRDILFDGGAHNITSGDYLGSEVSISRSYGRTDTITLGEFCALARAIMTLYGEPVITDMERDACIKLYGVVIPEGNYTDEVYESILYLSAKGIIDPEFKDFNTRVTFKDIEEILLRIADTDSRLTIKDPAICALSSENFVAIERVALAGAGEMLYTSSSDNIQYKDYLIQIVPGINDYQVVRKIVGNTPIIQPSTSKGTTGTQVSTSASTTTQTVGQPVFSTQNLTINGYREATGIWINAGIETYEGIQFYHLKISDNAFYSHGDYVNNDHHLSMEYVLNKDEEEFPEGHVYGNMLLSGAQPGVYRYSNTFRRTTFAEEGFTYEYRDNDTQLFSSWNFNASSNLYAITLSETDLDAALNIQGFHGSTWAWSNLQGGEKNRVQLTDGVTASLFPMYTDDATGKVFWRLELYSTLDYSTLFNDPFMSNVLTGGVKTETGFYRTEDGILLVSVQSLKDRGLVKGITDLGGDTYVLSVNNSNVMTNVIIHDSKDATPNFIMVGDTLYPTNKSEALFRDVGGEPYINYKATTGWAYNVLLVPTGSAGVVYVATTENLKDMYAGWGGNTGNYTNRIKTANIYNLPYKASMRSMVHNYLFSGKLQKGIALTGSYPLANYCVVSTAANREDDLFVYHIRTGNTKEDEWDEDARTKFKELTSYNLESSSTYYLRHTPLNLDALDVTFNPGLNAHKTTSGGLVHATSKYVQSQNNVHEYSFGWYWDPPEFSTVTDGLEAWANGDMLLPFFIYDGDIYDANINRLKYTPGDILLSPGYLPAYYLSTSNQSNALATVTATGALKKTMKSLTPYSGYNDSDLSLVAAPAGNFAIFKTGVEKTVSEVYSGADLYYGTSRVQYDVSKKKLKTTGDGYFPDTSDATKAVRTFYGEGTSSVFVVEVDVATATFLIDVDSLLDSDFSTEFAHAADLVDWDQFSFHVLVTNLDQWTSILLIFILNVLPRVCMLLCFLLMLFSLAKDWQPWVNFCNNHFDVYKALTLGYLNVNVIELKKTVLYSLICFSIFFMILDGALFNVIIWFCRWFINIYQR